MHVFFPIQLYMLIIYNHQAPCVSHRAFMLTIVFRYMLSDDEDYYTWLAALGERRRQAMRNAEIVSALMAAAPAALGPQGPNRPRQAPFNWDDHCRRLNPAEFKRRYRLTPAAFDKLLGYVREDLSVENVKQAQNSKGTKC